MSSNDPTIAVGPGPRWFRIALTAIATLYLAALVKHPPDNDYVRPVGFFTEATCLFPRASTYAIEYRLQVWKCGEHWESIDPTPYFPIQPDDKESRLQRLGYFYERNRGVMQALDAYISERHAEGVDDGVTGAIGGIRLVKIVRKFPEPGESVDRYHFDPFAPIPKDELRDLYYTPGVERKRRCAMK